MRLLFFDLTLPHLLADEEVPVGGATVQLEQWLKGLAELGVHAGVLTRKGGKAAAGPQTRCELLETFDPDSGIRVLKYFYVQIPSLLAAARSFKPDAIVQSCACVYTAILAHAARRQRVPFVYRVASDSDVDGRTAALLRGYENVAYRYGLRRASLIVCQNEAQVSHVAARLPRTPTLRIPNSISASPGAAQSRPAAGRSSVAWVGVFRREKNLPLLARIARALPAVNFRVAGMAVTPAAGDIVAAMNDLKRLPNVELTGYLKRGEIAGFLGQARALLCTSDFEGFPNTFLEAFAAGTPVVTRKDIDPDGIIGRLGLGVSAATEEDLIQGVSTMMAMSPDAFDGMSRECRRYVADNHTPRAAMQSLVNALEPLIVR